MCQFQNMLKHLWNKNAKAEEKVTTICDSLVEEPGDLRRRKRGEPWSEAFGAR